MLTPVVGLEFADSLSIFEIKVKVVRSLFNEEEESNWF